jgi:hypothetical protein
LKANIVRFKIRDGFSNKSRVVAGETKANRQTKKQTNTMKGQHMQKSGLICEGLIIKGPPTYIQEVVDSGATIEQLETFTRAQHLNT